MAKYLSTKAEILKEPQDKMSSQLALFNRENIYLEAFVLKSKEVFIGRPLRSANKRLLADHAKNIFGHQCIAAIF